MGSALWISLTLITFSVTLQGQNLGWSRLKKEWKKKRERNWKLTFIINSSLKNLLQKGAIAEMACEVEELFCCLRWKRIYMCVCVCLCVCVYFYIYMHTTYKDTYIQYIHIYNYVSIYVHTWNICIYTCTTHKDLSEMGNWWFRGERMGPHIKVKSLNMWKGL